MFDNEFEAARMAPRAHRGARIFMPLVLPRSRRCWKSEAASRIRIKYKMTERNDEAIYNAAI